MWVWYSAEQWVLYEQRKVDSKLEVSVLKAHEDNVYIVGSIGVPAVVVRDTDYITDEYVYKVVFNYSDERVNIITKGNHFCIHELVMPILKTETKDDRIAIHGRIELSKVIY